MHYYIDGYNLMFRVIRAGDDLQEQRYLVVEDLKKKINFLKMDATLVFDAQYQLDEGSHHHIKLLEIRFTDHGVTADDFIISDLKLEKNPREHTIVTSDQKLAWRARRLGAKTETIEKFISALNKRYQKNLNKSADPVKQLPKKRTPSEVDPGPPSEKASLDECFDYYLHTFEKKDQKKKK